MIINTDEIIELEAKLLGGASGAGLVFNLRLLPGDEIALVELGRVNEVEVVDMLDELGLEVFSVKEPTDPKVVCIFEVQSSRLDESVKAKVKKVRVECDFAECVAKIPDFERNVTKAVLKENEEVQEMFGDSVNESELNPLHGAW